MRTIKTLENNRMAESVQAEPEFFENFRLQSPKYIDRLFRQPHCARDEHRASSGRAFVHRISQSRDPYR